MGSDSDLPVMFPAARILDHFQIPYEPMNVSTHRMLGWLVEHLVARGERGSHLGMIGILYSSTVRQYGEGTLLRLWIKLRMRISCNEPCVAISNSFTRHTTLIALAEGSKEGRPGLRVTWIVVRTKALRPKQILNGEQILASITKGEHLQEKK